MTKNIKNTVIQIQTPKGFLLNGLLFGAEKPKTVYIYVHGLGSSMFSQTELLQKLVDKNSSALTFSNRGYGVVNNIWQIISKNPIKYKKHVIGMAHEVFTDCIDDIEGAVKFVSDLGVKNIILVGHSTGCQKSIYYLAKKTAPLVQGVILLAPMSDFADTFKYTDKKIYNKAIFDAKKLVKDGKQHELLPFSIWPDMIDAQRFLSLFTPDSIEEIFSYASGQRPVLLIKNKKPILVILAEKDEFSDRPIFGIFNWFQSTLQNKKYQLNMIEGSAHRFQGYSDILKKIIKDWVSKL